ncbi:unnamed protein product [Peronospora effusa]|nr:unnamed protein product [Peronospora effusa]
MDADDEASMTYFLPDGIADDSPPKKSRTKASFGPIGGRNTAGTISQSIATSNRNTAVIIAAPAASNLMSDVDLSGLYTRPCATLETSPFSSSGSSESSSRPTNLLQSDLRGDMHSFRASRDFGDSGETISSFSPFVKPVSLFNSGLSDGEVLGGTGGIRSSDLMFCGGQEAAKDFYKEGESRRSILATETFGKKKQQLYHGEGMSSYLRAEESGSPFRLSSKRTWPSLATEVSQPRRILQRPPGLPDPPGLSEPIGMQSLTGLGSRGKDIMQQQASSTQFRPFSRSTLSPLVASKGAPNEAFSSGKNQYKPSSLSSLNSSTGIVGDSSLRDQTYSRFASTSGLTELKTHSTKVNEMESMRTRKAVDASYNREPTTSRRIDVKASSKMLRSPKEARGGSKKAEGRSNIRTKALELSIDAINVSAPGSPIIPKRSDRGCEMASSVTARGNPLYVNESSRTRNDPSVARGKRRNQVGDKGAALSSYGTGGNDGRCRKMHNQSDETSSMVSPPPGLKGRDGSMKLTSRDSGKARREDTKSSSRTASKRNPMRGNDKGTGTTRRQVYREKHDKESVLGQFLSEEAAPIPASLSRQNSQRSNDGPISPEANFQELEEDTRQDAETSAFSKTSGSILVVPSSINARIDDVDETADKSMDKSRGQREILASCHDEVAAKRAHDARSIYTAPPEGLLTTYTCSTKREPSLSSNVPVYEPTTRKELAEQAQVSLDQQLLESKKLKKKAVVSVEPPSESILSAKRGVGSAPCADDEKSHLTKERRKEKTKKEKVDKKTASRGRKDKRGASVISKAIDTVNNSAAEAQDKQLKTLAIKSTPLSARFVQGLRNGASIATTAVLLAYSGTRHGCVWIAWRLNIKGLLATAFSYAESVLAMVFSVVLLVSLHVASWLIRIHQVAFRAILTHRHIGFCFTFLYGFPFLVQYVFPWAPPWAPVCLWYAFLVQLFCTNGSTAMVTTFRIILPLVFLVEGISHHSFLLDLNGAELLLTSFIISALKTSDLCSPLFFLSLATQCLLAVFLGSNLIVQWLQLTLALYSLHVMAATDDEWIGIDEEEDDLSFHPPIVDYNHHPTPSSAVSIQKNKRLDRRTLAYVRKRKLR